MYKIPALQYIVVLGFVCSCSTSPNIQTVKHSSPLLHCEKIFADNTDAIDERNEILLQTGVIDTTDELPPIETAIINIDNEEIILTLKKSYTENGYSIEKYSGQNYDLTLTYKRDQNNNGSVAYIGKFVIEINKHKTEFSIEGRNCNL
ncbi:MAG TPA: hypothetical protein VKR53_18320 [Puia sp.]|nr:hypothetical protein [Puia sp.]